jgi:mono/diheme cytochrome c family protein
MSGTKRILWTAAVLAAIQLVPFGHTHTNPPANGEPKWDSPATRALFRRACFDCHSNETTWPWYSNVAPVSWLVERDVNDGRRHLDLTLGIPQRHFPDVAHEIASGDMPPWFYLPMHPAARPNDAEKQAMIEGATKTFGPQK